MDKKDNIKVKVATAVNLLDVDVKKVNIPEISKLYNFRYTSEGLRMWKAFGIGKGKNKITTELILSY